jgi:hypothetical protein
MVRDDQVREVSGEVFLSLRNLPSGAHVSSSSEMHPPSGVEEESVELGPPLPIDPVKSVHRGGNLATGDAASIPDAIAKTNEGKFNVASFRERN